MSKAKYEEDLRDLVESHNHAEDDVRKLKQKIHEVRNGVNLKSDEFRQRHKILPTGSMIELPHWSPLYANRQVKITSCRISTLNTFVYTNDELQRGDMCWEIGGFVIFKNPKSKLNPPFVQAYLPLNHPLVQPA